MQMHAVANHLLISYQVQYISGVDECLWSSQYPALLQVLCNILKVLPCQTNATCLRLKASTNIYTPTNMYVHTLMQALMHAHVQLLHPGVLFIQCLPAGSGQCMPQPHMPPPQQQQHQWARPMPMIPNPSSANYTQSGLHGCPPEAIQHAIAEVLERPSQVPHILRCLSNLWQHPALVPQMSWGYLPMKLQ